MKIKMSKAAEAVLMQMKVGESIIAAGLDNPPSKQLPETDTTWGHEEIDAAIGKPAKSTDAGLEKVPPNIVPDERSLKSYPRTLSQALGTSPKEFNDAWSYTQDV